MKTLLRTHHLKRNSIIAAAIVIVAGASAFAYYKYGMPATQSPQSTTTQTTNDSPTTTEQQQAGDSQKQATIDKDQSASTPTSSFGVTITAANQNGAVLNIRSLIDKVASSGSCTLTLTKGSAIVTKKVDIQALAESSTCKGFDVPTSELSKGTWHMVLTVTIGSGYGKASQDIVVN